MLLGSLAQLVEQRTFNPLVPRSNRGRPTTYLISLDGSLAQLVEQRTFNPLVPRSNRGRPTILSLECLPDFPYYILIKLRCFGRVFLRLDFMLTRPHHSPLLSNLNRI